MTLASHAPATHLAELAAEPPRFVAYALGCGPAPTSVVDRLLSVLQALLVPGLSGVERRGAA